MAYFRSSIEPAKPIDFTGQTSPPGLQLGKMLTAGGITLAQCRFQPNSGSVLRFSQVVVGVHEGARLDLDWRPAESDHRRSETLTRGRVLLVDAGVPAWKQWGKPRAMFAIAIEHSFVRHLWERSFEGAGNCTIRTAVGAADPVIAHLATLARRELFEQGANGKVYLEGITSALVIHLLRSYGFQRRWDTLRKGGLGASRLRRVTEYIDAHLNENIGLLDLADLTGLTPQYFSEAFKRETGAPPHQFIIEQRVQRGQVLLRDKCRSIAAVGYDLGFSSQSHFTRIFRRITGITPARFRRSID